MEENILKEYTPDYIDHLLTNEIFVFGSNILGYHAGGAAKMARKKFGAIWGQAEGLQGRSYAIPVDYGKGVRNDIEVKAAIDRFISFAKQHPEYNFLVVRIGCATGGYRDDEIGPFFKEALNVNNIRLPKSFVEAIEYGKVDFDLDRFVKAQDSEHSYSVALSEIKQGCKRSHWIWYVFPQIKGLGHSYRSEYFGISCKEEAESYLSHPVLGERLREITQALLDCDNPSASNILGNHDAAKVQSCMTLFDIISPKDIFNDVLWKYYEGKRCAKTVRRFDLREGKDKNAIRTSRLRICKDCSIELMDFKREIKMEPIVKAVYLLFLMHPEGIAFKHLPDYRKELANIYQKIKPFGLNERASRSIEDVTNPLLNSINEKCSRIRAAFQPEVDPTLLDMYTISGKSGEAKKITLPRELVIWE